jgi:hypothetical protein
MWLSMGGSDPSGLALVSVYSDDSPVRHSEIDTWTSLWLSTGGLSPSV